MLDYPNKTACVVFTPGCNFRCGYCHNPEFVLPEKIQQIKNSFIPESVFLNFLKERRDFLDGVVVTGGEPTMMPDLLDFLKRIKSLGFLIKLDTNGNRPETIKKAIETGVVDYIAMDVKTSLEEYPKLAGRLVSPEKIKESVELLKKGSVDYEFRSTLIKEVHSDIILKAMAELVFGAKVIYLQNFRPGITLDQDYARYLPFSAAEMNGIIKMFDEKVNKVELR